MKKGILLVNTGSPDAPTKKAVRRYLKEFLSDPRVMDAPFLIRKAVLYLIILPFRPKRSAALYQKIWTDRGSPLIAIGQEFAEKLQKELDRVESGIYRVRLAMRYGHPSLEMAMEAFRREKVDEILLVPLFPQNAEATTGSIVARVREILSRRKGSPDLKVLPPFYHRNEFLDPLADSLKSGLARLKEEGFEPDGILFSYHGLPERQIKKNDATGICLTEGCCDHPDSAVSGCYRAQCHATTGAILERVDLPTDAILTTFQSRMGRIPWIGPHTDEILKNRNRYRFERVLILAPAFVADCLETLEELQIQARETFLQAGGKDLRYLPALNAGERWVRSFAGLIRSMD